MNIEFGNLTNSPLSYIIVGVVSVLFGWLVKGNKAPKWMRKYLDHVLESSGKTIQATLFDLIAEVEVYTDKTGAEKKAWVTDRIYEIAQPYIGPIGKPILDSLIEWVYQAWKKKNKR